jgi:hypothetical protein
MICQYCGGENISTEAPTVVVDDGLTRTVAEVAQVYWRWYRGIGRSSEVIEFTDDLAKALGEYKGDGA